MYQHSPTGHQVAAAHYRTEDWGEIAVRYLTEKARITTDTDLLKPEHFGARTPINLGDRSRWPRCSTTLPTRMRCARSGARGGEGAVNLDEAKFKDVLVNAGADPEYAVRAYRKVVNEHFSTPEQFFNSVADAAGGAGPWRAMPKAMWRVRARIEGLSEEDWLHKRMANVAYAGWTRRQRWPGMTDAREGQPPVHGQGGGPWQGPHRHLQLAKVTEFRNKFAHVADREHFLILR